MNIARDMAERIRANRNGFTSYKTETSTAANQTSFANWRTELNPILNLTLNRYI
jgi:hypothetical protein